MKEFYVADKWGSLLHPLDNYSSMIWIERFAEMGEVDTILPASKEAFDICRPDRLIVASGSTKAMIIESRTLVTDAEGGDHLQIKGRCLLSLLARRIIADRKAFTGNRQGIISTLLTENVISPSNSNRDISGFSFAASTNPAITSQAAEVQFLGENLYSAIKGLVDIGHWGMKVDLKSDGSGYEFRLYLGVDRSEEQVVTPWIQFSPEFDNILDSEYTESTIGSASSAYVLGQSIADEPPVAVWAHRPNKSDWARREIVVNASGTVKGELTTVQYNNQLGGIGLAELAKHEVSEDFSGTVMTSGQYEYGVDYDLGDIVQFTDKYGNSGPARVSEYMWAHDAEGMRAYPTFEMTGGS